MKFCSECGALVEQRIPDDDNRIRDVCPSCHTIHYQNPKIVAGTIPIWKDEHSGEVKILLCKRAIEPRYGYWTLPAGFMELGESTEGAALRETEEEAGAQVTLRALFSLLNVPHIGQVHLFYRANLMNLNFAPGSESLAVQLYTESEIPWDELAFPTVIQTIKAFWNHYHQHGLDANYDLYSLDILPQALSNLSKPLP